MFNRINIENPKIEASNTSHYNYYAAYNPKFVNSILNSINLAKGSTLLDP